MTLKSNCKIAAAAAMLLAGTAAFAQPGGNRSSQSLPPLPAASSRWQVVMPKLIAKYASDNPFPWYKSFLLDTVVPNSHVFATVTALGEIGVGLSLLLGLLTPLGAFFGVIQVLLYGMAVQQQSSGQQGFHVMLMILMLTFLFTRAGRRWGLDARLRERWPSSRLVQLLT